MLRVCLLVASLSALAQAQTPALGPCPKVTTQSTLDLKSYLGTWYEIYAFPTTFEGGRCTRAQYTQKDNGHVNILNRSITNNKTIMATGDAFCPDPKNAPAKFLVQFAKGAPYSHYWVVDTDYKTYSLIYSCEDVAVAHIEFAWILGRNMTLADDTVKRLQAELGKFKVDVSKFTLTDQKDCPP